MSVSTIFLKTPHCSDLRMKTMEKQGSSTLLVMSLWLMTSIFSVAKSEFSSNITGVAVSFNVQDVLFMLFTSWLLQKGLTTRNVILCAPWMILSTYSLYYNDYRVILKMMNILKHLRGNHTLPWLMICFRTIGLFIRILLSLRIVQLSANLWYRNKLEKELYIQNYEKQGSSTLLVMSLWLMTSIFSVAKSEFSSNITGVAVSFNVQDVLFMLFTSWLLQKGLTTRNVILCAPWMILSTYSLYYNDYRVILKMMNILKHLRGNHTLPWLMICFRTIGLFIRILLSLRIVQLSANLWYRNKLEKELYM